MDHHPGSPLFSPKERLIPSSPSTLASKTSPRPFTYKHGYLYCDQVPLTTLSEQFGTPLYVYSKENLVGRFELFQRAFVSHPATVCYAVKANSSISILRLLAKRGAGFDIVSGGELERVRRASRSALTRVVFSGVGKQIWEMDAALHADILLFNVESEAELQLLAKRAESMGKRARFALRVNPDVSAETHPYISTGLREHKFGVDIKLARALYRKAARLKWLDPAGVSVHIGSQIRSVDPFAAAMRRVVELVHDLNRDGHAIRYIDAGGGLGIDYADKGSFDPELQVDDYAGALLPILRESKVHLLLEPGRFLVAQAGGLLTQVLYVKQNGTKSFVVTDAGMNDLIRPALYQAHHEVLPIRKPKRPFIKVVDIVGPVCESGDFFARDRPLADVRPGSFLLLLDAGAYGMSQTSNYNTRPRPAEVLIDGDDVKLIRRRETLQDLFGPEVIA